MERFCLMETRKYSRLKALTQGGGREGAGGAAGIPGQGVPSWYSGDTRDCGFHGEVAETKPGKCLIGHNCRGCLGKTNWLSVMDCPRVPFSLIPVCGLFSSGLFT